MVSSMVPPLCKYYYAFVALGKFCCIFWGGCYEERRMIVEGNSTGNFSGECLIKHVPFIALIAYSLFPAAPETKPIIRKWIEARTGDVCPAHLQGFMLTYGVNVVSQQGNRSRDLGVSSSMMTL